MNDSLIGLFIVCLISFLYVLGYIYMCIKNREFPLMRYTTKLCRERYEGVKYKVSTLNN